MQDRDTYSQFLNISYTCSFGEMLKDSNACFESIVQIVLLDTMKGYWANLLLEMR